MHTWQVSYGVSYSEVGSILWVPGAFKSDTTGCGQEMQSTMVPFCLPPLPFPQQGCRLGKKGWAESREPQSRTLYLMGAVEFSSFHQALGGFR